MSHTVFFRAERQGTQTPVCLSCVKAGNLSSPAAGGTGELLPLSEPFSSCQRHGGAVPGHPTDAASAEGEEAAAAPGTGPAESCQELAETWQQRRRRRKRRRRKSWRQQQQHRCSGPPLSSGSRCSAPLTRPARGCRERLHALGPPVRSRGRAQPERRKRRGARGRRPRPTEVAVAHGYANGRTDEARVCGSLALPEAAAPVG